MQSSFILSGPNNTHDNVKRGNGLSSTVYLIFKMLSLACGSAWRINRYGLQSYLYLLWQTQRREAHPSFSACFPWTGDRGRYNYECANEETGFRLNIFLGTDCLGCFHLSDYTQLILSFAIRTNCLSSNSLFRNFIQYYTHSLTSPLYQIIEEVGYCSFITSAFLSYIKTASPYNNHKRQSLSGVQCEKSPNLSYDWSHQQLN